MGLSNNFLNWYQMCLNLIYCNFIQLLCYLPMTTNIIIIFILYFYTYLLLFMLFYYSYYLLLLLKFIEFIEFIFIVCVYCIYWNCIYSYIIHIY